METGLSVSDVMTRSPIQVPANMSVFDCANLMKEKGIGSLIITSNDQLLGIVTEQDLVRKIVAQAKAPKEVVIGDIMTKIVVTISPGKDIYKAMTLMRDHNVRHLPVLDGDSLQGFLTWKDILKVEPQLFDMILDNIHLREEERKLALRSEGGSEGFCELCGNFSDSMVRNAQKLLICDDCRQD